MINNKQKTPALLRFIPNRAMMDIDLSHFKITQDQSSTTTSGATTNPENDAENVCAYDTSAIRDKLDEHRDAKILAFKERAPKAQEGT